MKFFRFLPKILLVVLAAFFIFGLKSVYADVSTIPECAQQNLTPSQCVDYLNGKVSALDNQKNTLNGQISAMTSQINLTQAQIYYTEQQINDLTLDIDTTTKKINSISQSIDNLTKVLINRIKATYEIGSAPSFQILATSSNINDFVKRANYLRLAQVHDKRLIYDTVQAKNDYSNQKNIFEDKKKKVVALQAQLESYSAQLDQEKAAKQNLLAQTQGSEANYQSLLAQAKAQLAGFSTFAQSQGGASSLSNQTVCDDWGCYYNQRDSQWGGNSLNGTGYTLASDGCLITSMAMVYTHYGHRGVNPQTINSDSWNFASYYPAYLNYTIRADGATSTRAGGVIDSELQAGRPVVVGIQYSNGGTHFVVLTDYNGGNYLMNDPFTENGHRIPFTSKYPLGSIFAVYRITGF